MWWGIVLVGSCPDAIRCYILGISLVYWIAHNKAKINKRNSQIKSPPTWKAEFLGYHLGAAYIYLSLKLIVESKNLHGYQTIAKRIVRNPLVHKVLDHTMARWSYM